MRNGKLYIHATNIHQGGGRSLLACLLRELGVYPEVICLLDDRMDLPEGMPPHGVTIKRVAPSIWQRLAAERWLTKNAKPGDTVLCFGNLPPLFKLRARCKVFVQNRYLIDDEVCLDGFPFRIRVRLAIERAWLSGRLSNADEFIVQTPTMARLMRNKGADRVVVRILPFVAEPSGYARDVTRLDERKKVEYDYLYVASGEPHKNHRNLFAAWKLLAENGLLPSLCVTLDGRRFAELHDEIEIMKQQHGIRISNVGELAHQQVLELYDKAGAMIYPSTVESFGLPLIEARQAGLQVLAAELDYVRDVLDPEQSFDPGSPLSICRAVKRHMMMAEPGLPLIDAAEFLGKVAE